MTVLALVDSAIPGLGRKSDMKGLERVDVLGALDALRHAQISLVPVLPSEHRRRLGNLRTLFTELKAA